MDRQCAIIFINLFVCAVIVLLFLTVCHIRFLMFDFESGHNMYELGRIY